MIRESGYMQHYFCIYKHNFKTLIRLSKNKYLAPRNAVDSARSIDSVDVVSIATFTSDWRPYNRSRSEGLINLNFCFRPARTETIQSGTPAHASTLTQELQ